MRKSFFLGVFVLALVFLVSLVASAPARLLSLVLPGEQIVLQGLSGTLWQGSASRCMMRLPAGYLHLGAVQWSLDPLSLLLLAPKVQLSSEWGQQRIKGELVLRGAQDLDVRDLEGQVQANLLRHFAPVALNGTFSMQIASLQLRDGLPHSGKGRVLWEQGSWQSPRGPIQLGSYALDFEQAEGAPLEGKVVTLEGPLEAEGGLTLDQRKYTLDILVGSQETLDPQLQQALSLVAAPEGDNYRLFLESDF
ncbi:MAG: general secretion pathway protein N [Halioglobus sp.]|jgi:general secretion pathway protein N